MMSTMIDLKQEFLEAVISGLSRVAGAILATPREARTKALDAVADSYRRTGRALDYHEAQIQEWVNSIMLRLREEVTSQELAQKNEAQDDAPSLVPESATQINKRHRLSWFSLKNTSPAIVLS